MLLSPRRTRSSINDARSYDIYFCVPFTVDSEVIELDRKENHEIGWAYWKWYKLNIHADGPGNVNQKQLIPFWKGKLPMYGGIAALGSSIYFFFGGGGEVSSWVDSQRVQITPRCCF
jgi:hypothetical protein